MKAYAIQTTTPQTATAVANELLTRDDRDLEWSDEDECLFEAKLSDAEVQQFKSDKRITYLSEL